MSFTVGYRYRIKLTAYNAVGSIIGNVIAAVAANVPADPTTAPTYDPLETNGT